MPRHASPVFIDSDFQVLTENNDMWRVLFAEQDKDRADIRYAAIRQKKPFSLAGYFSVAAAVMAYRTPDGNTFFQFYKAIDWSAFNEDTLESWRQSDAPLADIKYDDLFVKPKHGDDKQRGLENDRFFAWASVDIIPVLEYLVKIGELKRESCPRLWGHPGATRSYKLVKYKKGNFQITLHEKRTRVIGGVRCLLVETDVDYFKQLFRHTLEEVLPHKLFRGLTNPRKVYVIEWLEQQASGADFAPWYGWAFKGSNH